MTLGSLGTITANKASGGDGIRVELLKILKDKDKVAVEEKFTMRKERAVIYKQGQSEEGTQSSHSPTADILGCEVKRTLRSITTK